eukprot:6195293-Pleurochrysis_carterae.AAC.1
MEALKCHRRVVLGKKYEGGALSSLTTPTNKDGAAESLALRKQNYNPYIQQRTTGIRSARNSMLNRNERPLSHARRQPSSESQQAP